MKGKRIIIILSILPFAIVTVLLPLLTDTIGMHFNSSGEITRYGSKFELYIIAFIFAIIGLLYIFLYHHLSKKDYKAIELSVMMLILCGIMIFLNIDLIYMILNSLNPNGFTIFRHQLNFDRIFFLSLSIVIYLVSLKFKNLPINSVIGLRLPWTIRNPESWKLSHKMCSKYMRIMSLFLIVVTLIIPKKLCTLANLSVLLLGVVFIIYKTYKICNLRMNKSKNKL